MSDEALSPERWAFKLTHILNAVHGDGRDRFPVDVKAVAKEISNQLFPDDPVTRVKGASLPGFEGSLHKAPPGKKGWGIFYNSDITSPGRINFTLAHEFGHYLLHRLAHPDGIDCNARDIVRWESEYRQIEHQANVFAANLLMPLDDFRRSIGDQDKPGFEELGECARRYEVSLIAAALRWIQYTRRRAMLVLSRDEFVLWARSSKRAFRTRLYIKTADRPPVPVPPSALAARQHELDACRGSTRHAPGVWFPEDCEELVLFSDQYDFTISLLHFSDTVDSLEQDEEAEEDVSARYDKLLNR
ncbi:ImmA/IrrE family metallo-endopeptidase [Thiocapsa rosea]|uniref:Uncharacterized protein DUF955 n=1 Tax=Thiocapsa rosea TaxID=69360 RepID=A0A495UNZ3_9GAMM|nr:ImmA/IrrE family metallo-endopeptidase [Thiocapsa rosea]RKT37980.1 uncharacterized protein DUF955 [Thiocapsa rosea]